MARERACLIIPTQNRKSTILRCLEHLKTIGDLSRFEVIVIDDGSTDGTSTAIQNRYSNITLLRGDGNLHWAGAIARGMQYAHTLDANYIFWLRDDCLPAHDSLNQMLKFLINFPRSLVGSTCFQENPITVVPSGLYKGRPVRLRLGEDARVDSLYGFCVGFDTSVMDTIGVPDAKKLPSYEADSIYTLQATRAGFKAFVLGAATATLLPSYQPTPKFPEYLANVTDRGFSTIFWNKTSPYDLRTQFYVHLYRHPIFGIFLYLGKIVFWLVQWVGFKKK